MSARAELPFRERPPPLIVIGMHRSGTSLVAAMLSDLGVYMGPASGEPEGLPDERSRRDGYAEADAFRQLNEELLAAAGADWNRVEPFLQRRNEPAFTQSCLEKMTLAMSDARFAGYLADLAPVGKTPWGWKDPRTTLTLPLWLKLFPQARIVHVRRDPERAAASLHTRAHVWWTPPPIPRPATRVLRALCHPMEATAALARRLGLLAPLPLPDPCMDLGYCRRLCGCYVSEGKRYRVLRERYLELHYEEVLRNPSASASSLAAFAGMSVGAERLDRAVRRVSAAR